MKQKKKLLIISVAAGSGHIRAAEAIYKEAKMAHPHLSVYHMEMTDFVSSTVKKIIADSYNTLIKNFPSLWKFLYKSTDKSTGAKAISELSWFINKFNAAKFFSLIENFKPDYILTTHFLPAHVLCRSSYTYCSTTPLGVVLTDYAAHNLWIHPAVSDYFVPTQEVKKQVEKMGAKKFQTHITGIPIQPVFFEKKSIPRLKDKFKIATGKKVLLVLAGGEGLIPTDKVIGKIETSIHLPLEVIAVAGNNQHLYKKFLKLKKRLRNISLHVFEWTNSIDELMRISDVIISKSGGITTTECITLQKPILVIDPIPGQEEANAQFIEKNKFGYVASNHEELFLYLERLLLGGSSSLRTSSKKISSAEKILRILSRNIS